MYSGATGAAAAIANATKASGVIVRVSPADFLLVLRRAEAPLVVHAEAGMFSKKQKYLTSYKGFAFFTRADELLRFPAGTEVVEAEKIWIPE
jgi:hypothetical protein